MADSKIFVVGVIWVTMWLSTFLNYRDMKLSAFFSSSGAIFGTIIPGILIIVLGVIHYLSGQPPEIHFSMDALIPDFDSSQQLMLLAAMLVSLLGMEMSAVHGQRGGKPLAHLSQGHFLCLHHHHEFVHLRFIGHRNVIPADSVSLSAGVCRP